MLERRSMRYISTTQVVLSEALVSPCYTQYQLPLSSVEQRDQIDALADLGSEFLRNAHLNPKTSINHSAQTKKKHRRNI
jgi:hypothetical protein